jgi:hypothetical protein
VAGRAGLKEEQMSRRSPHQRRNRRRVAGALGLLGASVTAAGKAAYGDFTGASSVAHSTSSGTLGVTVGNGDADQAFALAMSNFFPGASRERLVDVTISGDAAFDDVSLDAAPPYGLFVDVSHICGSCDSSLLDSDVTNGLQIKIDRCSQPWAVANGSSPNETYTCPADQYAVVSSRSIVGSKNLTPNADASNTNPGDVNHYRFTFTLPTTSPDTMEGLSGANSSILEFKFGGTQRDATNK